MPVNTKPTEKELLEIRNKIFIEKGIPALESNGFLASPFSTARKGRNNLGDYTYELCRLSEGSQLEEILTHICRGDRWIQIHLNIFKLFPEIRSIEQLKNVGGLNYHLPPNSITRMRLHSDDIRGIPLFNSHFMFGGHKLKSFSTEAGLEKRIKKLGSLIDKDLTNIDSFVKRWFELHQPAIVDWEGNRLESSGAPGKLPRSFR